MDNGASFYGRLEESESGGTTFEGHYRSSEHTGGPWERGLQHAGPPAALALRAVQQLGPQPQRALPARLTAEILAPIPVDDLWVRARLRRPGRRVAWGTAQLGTLDEPDRPLLRCAVWLIRRTGQPMALPHTAGEPAPARGTERAVPPSWEGGYLQAVRWEFTDGSFAEPGPATAWTTLLVDLVEGETTTGAQHAAVVADAASGISAVADTSRLVFVNTELSIHLQREPVGPSLWMTARTALDPHGVGCTHTVLGDADGEAGTADQTLFVDPR